MSILTLREKDLIKKRCTLITTTRKICKIFLTRLVMVYFRLINLSPWISRISGPEVPAESRDVAKRQQRRYSDEKYRFRETVNPDNSTQDSNHFGKFYSHLSLLSAFHQSLFFFPSTHSRRPSRINDCNAFHNYRPR